MGVKEQLQALAALLSVKKKTAGIHSIREQAGLRRELYVAEKKVFLALSEYVPQIFQVLEQLLY